MSRARMVALLAAFALLAPAAVASAHGGNPNYRSVITAVSPRDAGVEFEVLDYDSYMQLRDRQGNEVVIYGYQDEPYARIMPDGSVEVNQRSPAAYLNDARFGNVKVPPIADAEAKPRWKRVDDSGTFIWHDHRMHYMSQALPPQVTDTGKKTKVFDYEIPISVNGTKGDIDGTLWWVGAASTSPLPFVLAGIAIVLAGGALVLFVRRRRRGEGDGGDEDGTEKAAEPAREAW